MFSWLRRLKRRLPKIHYSIHDTDWEPMHHDVYVNGNLVSSFCYAVTKIGKWGVAHCYLHTDKGAVVTLGGRGDDPPYLAPVFKFGRIRLEKIR